MSTTPGAQLRFTSGAPRPAPIEVQCSTPEEYLEQERRQAVNKAIALIKQGRPGRALYEITRSVSRQERIVGVAVEVPTVLAVNLMRERTGGQS